MNKPKPTPYVEQTLIEGEHVILQGKVSPWFHVTMVPAFLGLEIIFLYGSVFSYTSEGVSPGILPYICLPLPLLVFIQSWLVIKSTELSLTNQRVISKTGILSVKTSELKVSQIESVEVEQNIFGRILKFGSVSVNGTGGKTTPAPGITEPFEFRKVVQQVTNKTN